MWSLVLCLVLGLLFLLLCVGSSLEHHEWSAVYLAQSLDTREKIIWLGTFHVAVFQNGSFSVLIIEPQRGEGAPPPVPSPHLLLGLLAMM